MPTLTIRLHPAQAAFRQSKAIYRGFVGGISTGKTFITSYDLLRQAKPGRFYMFVCPTYKMLKRADLRMLMEIGRMMNYIRDVSDMTITLGNKAQITCCSAEDPESLRGPNASGVVLCEASLMHEDAYLICIGRLREAGEQGWLSAGFTPKGRQHWTYKVFGRSTKETELFTARTADNPFNPPGYDALLRTQYTSAFAEQELDGKFVDLAGTVAKREWFRILDARPACTRMVRAWDFAATPEDGQGRGDYTAGALLGEYDRGWVCLDMVRARVAGGQIAALVKRTAEMDGRGVHIGIEQEPGSSGKVATAYLTRELAGWSVKPIPVNRDKLTRAMPLLAQAEAGNVQLVKANWNPAVLDELASFPGGEHDDQVDALAHAFNCIAGRPQSFVAGPWAA